MSKRYYPVYDKDTDYNTNAPSFYEFLAKVNEQLKLSLKRLDEYDQTMQDKLLEISDRLDYYIEEWDKNLEDFPDDVKILLNEWIDTGVLDDIINENIFNDLNTKIDNNHDEVTSQLTKRVQILDVDKTFKIPTDYANLQEAIDDLIKFKPNNNKKIEILIESGYQIPNGQEYADNEGTDNIACLVKDSDASHIVIKSEDNVVKVSEDFLNSVFRTIRGKAPILNCLIDANNQGTNDFCCGYSAEMGSIGWVMDNAGVINCYGIGLRARQTSTIYTEQDNGVNFSGAGNRCVGVNHGSRAYIRNGNFSDSGNLGLRARGSVLVDAEGSKFNNCQIGIYGADNVNIHAERAEVMNCDTGVSITRASLINLSEAVITGNKDNVYITHNSHANLDNADCSMSSNFGVRVRMGSTVNLRNVNCQRESGVDNSNNIVAESGSTISASGATGGTNQDVNIPTQEGIIYRETYYQFYETGFFNPEIPGTATYGTQQARYTKIGDTVHVVGTLELTSKGDRDDSESVVLRYLPFDSIQTIQTVGTVEINNFDLTSSDIEQIGCFISPEGNQVSLRKLSRSNLQWGNINFGEIEDNTRFIFNITYKTDD